MNLASLNLKPVNEEEWAYFGCSYDYRFGESRDEFGNELLVARDNSTEEILCVVVYKSSLYEGTSREYLINDKAVSLRREQKQQAATV
jgi:hypothetical protein